MYLFLLNISFKGKERCAKADFMVAKLHSVNQRRVRLPAVFVGTKEYVHLEGKWEGATLLPCQIEPN